MSLHLGSGPALRIGAQLARGGEGAIFAVDSTPGVVFKRFHDDVLAKGSHRRMRIEAMVGNRPTGWREPASGHVLLTWPSDTVLDGNRFVGFVMPRIDVAEAAELHNVANPSDRRDPTTPMPAWVRGFTWRHLVHTASNLALATQLLHDQGVVIGDYQERNIFVWSDTRVTLVDCDSMQVTDTTGRVFHCEVGRPEFTAPELIGADLPTTVRRPSSDLFALAVHIHQLLLQGAHPFDGVWHGPGDKPKRQRLAAQGELVGVSGKLAPAPDAVPFDLLPGRLGDLFVQAFVEGATAPERRPTGGTWRTALGQTARELEVCAREKAHVYPGHHRRCPWCARAKTPPTAPMAPTTAPTAPSEPRTQVALPVAPTPRPRLRPGPHSPANVRAAVMQLPDWVHGAVVAVLVLLAVLGGWRALGFADDAAVNRLITSTWSAMSGADNPAEVVPDCPEGTSPGWQVLPAFLLALVNVVPGVIAILGLRLGLLALWAGAIVNSGAKLFTQRFEPGLLGIGGILTGIGVAGLAVSGILLRTMHWLAGYCY